MYILRPYFMGSIPRPPDRAEPDDSELGLLASAIEIVRARIARLATGEHEIERTYRGDMDRKELAHLLHARRAMEREGKA